MFEKYIKNPQNVHNRKFFMSLYMKDTGKKIKSMQFIKWMIECFI